MKSGKTETLFVPIKLGISFEKKKASRRRKLSYIHVYGKRARSFENSLYVSVMSYLSVSHM